MGWRASEIPDQSGRVAVVTGGNGGLGLATARQLAAHGARAVIGARDLDKAEAARKAIETTVPSASLEIRKLDLGSLTAIVEFAVAVRTAHPAPCQLSAAETGLCVPLSWPDRFAADGRNGVYPFVSTSPGWGSRGRQVMWRLPPSLLARYMA